MAKLNLKRPDRADKKATEHKLPGNISRKYEAVITPTTLVFPSMRIDMRNMTMEQADAVFDYAPGRYLKLVKETTPAVKDEKKS